MDLDLILAVNTNWAGWLIVLHAVNFLENDLFLNKWGLVAEVWEDENFFGKFLYIFWKKQGRYNNNLNIYLNAFAIILI